MFALPRTSQLTLDAVIASRPVIVRVIAGAVLDAAERTRDRIRRWRRRALTGRAVLLHQSSSIISFRRSRLRSSVPSASELIRGSALVAAVIVPEKPTANQRSQRISVSLNFTAFKVSSTKRPSTRGRRKASQLCRSVLTRHLLYCETGTLILASSGAIPFLRRSS